MILSNNSDSNMAPTRKEARKPSTRTSSDTEDYDDDDYRKRRDKNNQAVKRSRYKTKQKVQETLTRVRKLKSENQVLEEKVKTLSKELSFLKELFLAHASNSQSSKLEGLDLNKLLEDKLEDVDKLIRSAASSDVASAK